MGGASGRVSQKGKSEGRVGWDRVERKRGRSEGDREVEDGVVIGTFECFRVWHQVHVCASLWCPPEPSLTTPDHFLHT